MAIDSPAEGPARGVAVISHPHPLFGGTLNNKVVQTLARACVQAGWRAVRYNFRGVEGSEGQFDHGTGEADDLRAVIAHAVARARAETSQAAQTQTAQQPDTQLLETQQPQMVPLVLAGFSFGAYVTTRVCEAGPHEPIKRLILVGTAASRFSVPALAPELHGRTLIMHGEDDEVVPLSAVLDWARPQGLPVTVVPQAGHFFHGKLPLLKHHALVHLKE